MNALEKRAVQVLASRAQAWVSIADMASLLQVEPVQAEDVLVDLTLDGLAVHRAEAGYRLAGPALARQALRDLLTHEHDADRVLRGFVRDGEFRVGVAVRRAAPADDELGFVMFELAVPAASAQAQAAVATAILQGEMGR